MAEIKDPENTIIMTLKDGEVVIELLPSVAPKHVERMKELARAKAYDNVAFHRVIDGFMAQTGDVENGNMEKNFNIRRAGTGGSDLPDLPAPSELTETAPDLGTLREHYRRYQFRSWLSEIDGPEAAAGIPAQTVGTPDIAPREKIAVSYETVFTWAQFDAWLAKIETAKLTALDTETTSLDSFEARIVGISNGGQDITVRAIRSGTPDGRCVSGTVR